MLLNTALLIIHGLVAVALLGAITHQTIAAWEDEVHEKSSLTTTTQTALNS